MKIQNQGILFCCNKTVSSEENCYKMEHTGGQRYEPPVCYFSSRLVYFLETKPLF